MKTATTVIPVTKSGKILMQLRDDGNGKKIPYPNVWNFLGGEKEKGETHIACGLREMREELELYLDSATLVKIFVYDHDDVVDDTVLACIVDENVRMVLHEGARIQWMSFGEVQKLNLGFEQARILPALKSFLLHNGLPVSG